MRDLYEANARQWVQDTANNEPAKTKTMAHLTRYDSTHGRFPGTVEWQQDKLVVNDDIIQICHQEDLSQLPWTNFGIDVVLECSGTFSNRSTAETHLEAGAKRVLFSQPAEADVDATIIYGINHQVLSGDETIISSASCSTNCVVPVISVLNDSFGVDGGVITTIPVSYTHLTLPTTPYV